MRAQRFFGACLIGVLALCGVGSEGAAQQVIRAHVADGLDLKIEIIRLEEFLAEGKPQTIEESLLRFAAGGKLTELSALYPEAPPYDEINVIEMFRRQIGRFDIEQPLSSLDGKNLSPPYRPIVCLLTHLRFDGFEAPILVTGSAHIYSQIDPKGSGLPPRVWFYSEPLPETHWTGRWDQAPGGPILFIASTEPPDRKLDPEERRAALQMIEAQLVNLGEP